MAAAAIVDVDVGSQELAVPVALEEAEDLGRLVAAGTGDAQCCG